ncbi:hypothetical protein [Candidatus Proelusimicrobium excrementi]|uniref:hypothetical protein n=1 Tax=Candidatus Proelusimicrobium excrementi TaxID=3416222 RepID=UPI003D152D4C
MIKTILSLLCAAVLLGACTSYNQKNYKKYNGISYEEYEKQRKEQQNQTQIEYIDETVGEEDIEDPYATPLEITEEDVVESVNSSYGEAVVVMASKKISLGKDAGYKEMEMFQTALDSAYGTAFSHYRADGFTYAMSPAGTVNPLSVMDVQCILSESFATAKGKAVCDYFFSQIPVEYAKEKENAKNL